MKLYNFDEFVNESKKIEFSKGDRVKVTNISTLDTKAKKYQDKFGVVTGVSNGYVQVKIDSSRGGEVEFRTSELEKVNEGLLKGASKETLARDTEESDIEYIITRQKRNKISQKMYKKDYKDLDHREKNTVNNKLHEGKNWNKLMKGVRSGETGPWSLVAIKNGKVTDQKIGIKDPNIIPAYWEEFKKKNSGAKFRIEDGTGRTVYSED